MAVHNPTNLPKDALRNQPLVLLVLVGNFESHESLLHTEHHDQRERVQLSSASLVCSSRHNHSKLANRKARNPLGSADQLRKTLSRELTQCTVFPLHRSVEEHYAIDRTFEPTHLLATLSRH
jgi:hypothetical protein